MNDTFEMNTVDSHQGHAEEQDHSRRYSNTAEDHEDEKGKKQPGTGKPRPLYAPDYKPDVIRARRHRARKYLGLDPNKPLKPHEKGSEKYLWARIRTTWQEPFSEFLGVMVLTCFYMGALAQSNLGATLSSAPGGYGYGDFSSIPWSTGVGSMLGIYISGDSGAYLNPAITLANCMFRGLPWRQLPITIFAQFMGALVAAFLIYGNYVAAIDWYSGYGVRSVPPVAKATANIFATYPQTWTPQSSRAIQILTPTMIVTIVVSALKDNYNNGVSKGGGNFFPLGMFFLSYGVAISFGFEASGAQNPAIDLAGRVMSSCVGYPREVWSNFEYFFWMPVALPFVGSCLGMLVYDLFVYTGASPVNSDWLGLEMLFDTDKMRRNKNIRVRARRDPHTDAV